MFEEIESLEFFAHVNLTSGIQGFIRNLEKNSALQKLKEIPLNIIENRMHILLEQPIDINYQHPMDTALSVYYYVTKADEIIFEAFEKFPYSWNWLLEMFKNFVEEFLNI